MHEVDFPTRDPRLLGEVIAGARVEALMDDSDRLRQQLGGSSIVCVNSTASGGGVAEMLRVLLPYVRGAGIDVRWYVIEGDPRFFEITKRVHNHLYGTPGDGGPLGDEERAHYEGVLEANAAELAAAVRPGDVVLIHDPQPAGLAAVMRRRGARVVWRCHVGTDQPTAWGEVGWAFLRRYLEPPCCDAYVFTKRSFAPAWMPADLVHEIAPSIDPFSPKNQDLAADAVTAILSSVGLLAGSQHHAEFRRADGSRRRVDRGADIVRTGPAPSSDVPMVVQISRWDALKDMVGVLEGFADFVVGDHDTQLVLAGPVVTSVADDPEGGAVLASCWEAWRRLPHHARSRIALACLPMTDPEENAVIVNALQRHATVVVQKSLAEGFGLTVSEAMYKRRPVIASAVGGIPEQIVDRHSGLLLDDPRDLDSFAALVAELIEDAPLRSLLGDQAGARVIDRFLPDTQLARWSAVVSAVLEQTADG